MRCPSSLVGTLAVLLIALSGCDGSGHVAGGTPGRLCSGSVGLADVQVTLYRMAGTTSEMVGHGITRADGRFELVAPGAKKALHLNPGEYRVTVESVGAVPLILRDEFAAADSTPLQVQWTTSSTQLDLDIATPSSNP